MDVGGEDSPSEQAVSAPERQANAGTGDTDVEEQRDEEADAVEAPAPAARSGLDAFLT
ncbi:MAG: hypothetical protein ACK5MT_20045 [Actinomycetales bacterium]